jgi:glutamate-5-semialdehyde dehydrogenase
MNKPERIDTATEEAMLAIGRRAREAAHALALA